VSETILEQKERYMNSKGQQQPAFLENPAQIKVLG
jgi:hypothetical protein